VVGYHAAHTHTIGDEAGGLACVEPPAPRTAAAKHVDADVHIALAGLCRSPRLGELFFVPAVVEENAWCAERPG
jgi:hypothetical protein